MKIRSKTAITCVLFAGLQAGIILTNIARAYDGDVDYSAPYVTLDPETGKLITVDPKQQQANGQPQPPRPNAPPQAGTADHAAGDTVAAAPPAASTASDSAPAPSSGTNVIAAVAGLLLIAGMVAVLRRKPAAEKTDT